MEVKRIPPTVQDTRGVITDLLERERIHSVTLITSAKGAVRGNHYHKATWQYAYILTGRMRVVAKSLPDGEPREALVEPGDLILHPPMEGHVMVAVEDSSFMVFTRGPRGGREYETDTYRLETPLVAPNA